MNREPLPPVFLFHRSAFTPINGIDNHRLFIQSKKHKKPGKYDPFAQQEIEKREELQLKEIEKKLHAYRSVLIERCLQSRVFYETMIISQSLLNIPSIKLNRSDKISTYQLGTHRDEVHVIVEQENTQRSKRLESGASAGGRCPICRVKYLLTGEKWTWLKEKYVDKYVDKYYVQRPKQKSNSYIYASDSDYEFECIIFLLQIADFPEWLNVNPLQNYLYPQDRVPESFSVEHISVDEALMIEKMSPQSGYTKREWVDY